MVNNDLETASNYSLFHRISNCQKLSKRVDLKSNTLLIDSCLTVNLISNLALLHDIHKVNKPLKVCCNAGVRTTNMMGTLGRFPEPVWHDPNAVANILSLHTVKKYYLIVYDSWQDDAFVLTDDVGNQHRFAPTGNGLYTYHKDALVEWMFINTVDHNKLRYSDRAQKDATLARKIQDIIMCPSTREYQHITAHHLLPNIPINRSDIAAADDVFGTNLASLKGKTVSRPGNPTEGVIDNVPSEIMDKFGVMNLFRRHRVCQLGAIPRYHIQTPAIWNFRAPHQQTGRHSCQGAPKSHSDVREAWICHR